MFSIIMIIFASSKKAVVRSVVAKKLAKSDIVSLCKERNRERN